MRRRNCTPCRRRSTARFARTRSSSERIFPNGKISTGAIQVDRAGEIEAYNQKRIGELKDRPTQIRAQQDFYAKKAQEADEKLKQLEDATNGLILSGISSLSGLPVDVSKLGKGDFADQAKTIAIGMIEKSPALHDAIAKVADQGSTIGGLLQNAEDIRKKIEDGRMTLGLYASEFQIISLRP